MVSGEIFRGRYRESFESRSPRAGQPLSYRFALPTANHVFLPGHRSWSRSVELVPAYDRISDLLPAILGEAGGLPKGGAAHLPTPFPGELVELPLSSHGEGVPQSRPKSRIDEPVPLAVGS